MYWRILYEHDLKHLGTSISTEPYNLINGVFVFIALSRRFGSFHERNMLMNRTVARALELILCGLRAMLQAHLFMYLACLQEPSQTHLKPIL